VKGQKPLGDWSFDPLVEASGNKDSLGLDRQVQGKFSVSLNHVDSMFQNGSNPSFVAYGISMAC
jgi:hypothetical protein